MTTHNIKHKQGFTIIEVVLVLAIAGLIFLMVFVALPALQRSQRDTQRREDLARLATAVTQFQANNNGKVPTAMTTMPTSANFIASYLGGADAFKDPDGTAYNIEFKVLSGNAPKPTTIDHKAYVYGKAKCDGETMVASGNTNDYAILYKLEGAGTYCQDNQ
ncbi:prepilin-type N-terminal cleavage/methylation domain-containing protein [Candidatus Saccharibacteria bacterium]|nr:prepilin-type N-terminal cleavage/methylation domain-containing protein [Candidatus Saccharibacteria bacterium]